MLDKFNNSSDSTKDLISDAQKAAGSLDDAAASGASALDDADTIIQNTRTAAGDFPPSCPGHFPMESCF